MSDPLNIAREVIAEEAEALRRLASSFETNADVAAVIELLGASRQIVVSGLGKSGDIGRKIAATLTSTGAPAVYVHPVEALHGDVGIVTPADCLIALSRSGNTDEILRFVNYFRRVGGPVVGVAQARESRLAELCRHMILLPDVPEAGPLNLAPTTSCVLMLAVGDALAMALLHARGFGPEDFAQYHPEGALGRRLLLRAEDLMHAGDDLPVVRAADSFHNLILEMTQKRLGLALIVSADGRLVGTFTDGDLRRIFERVEQPRKLDARAAYAGSRRPADSPAVRISAVAPAKPAVDCLQFMQESQITSLIVVDESQRPIGVLRLLDLLRAGLG